MTIPPYHARPIYNSRMHSCPVMTPGSRPSRTKSCSRVRSAAPRSETAGFHAAFDEESIAGSIVPVKYWEKKGKRPSNAQALVLQSEKSYGTVTVVPFTTRVTLLFQSSVSSNRLTTFSAVIATPFFVQFVSVMVYAPSPPALSI